VPGARWIALGDGDFALVDEGWYEFLSLYKWRLHSKYAGRRITIDGRKVVVYMHRVVAQAGASVEVDHANGNRLDNRASNVRLATRSENMRNRRTRSARGLRGVVFRKDCQLWQARHRGLRGERVHIGYFKTVEEAAKAVDAAERDLGSLFSVFNYPVTGERRA